jgi:crossover junction endodeoxyribonuclease RusA
MIETPVQATRSNRLRYVRSGNRGFLQLSDDALDLDISLPFPIEFVIRDTPRSHQSPNMKRKELWKQKVVEAASAHVKTLRDFFFIDRRALAATIFYFPPGVMEEDIDNIVKLIVDGMVTVLYPDDQMLERIVVQKFEPGIEAVFRSPTPTLERAVEMEPPGDLHPD